MEVREFALFIVNIVIIFTAVSKSHNAENRKMKIAIIGAGPAGLITEKYALEQGFECDVFEQIGEVGGTWVYTDRVGLDENGLPVHTPMYKGLWTNLPKEVMSFLDFPYPEQKRSYIPQSEVLEYFKTFADQFNLRAHIKFFKYVTEVEPIPDQKWAVTVQDAKTKNKETKHYDAVFVCNGHYREPIFPKIPGMDVFKGTQIHSHVYRTPGPFTGKKVLLIGAGPSGIDISVLIAAVAEQVFLSHNSEMILNRINPSNLKLKPVVKYFHESGAVFNDDTNENFDAVIYCTGYNYSFPFLTESSQIKVDNKWVNPLYKDIVNIEHPTMFFIGIPSLVCVIPMFDIQARFALAALGGNFKLPPKNKMQEELNKLIEDKKEKGIPKKYFHKLDTDGQPKYFNDLAETAKIRKIPNVVNKLYTKVKVCRIRQASFRIIDEETFEQIE